MQKPNSQKMVYLYCNTRLFITRGDFFVVYYYEEGDIFHEIR